jgi:hypothetical protein
MLTRVLALTVSLVLLLACAAPQDTGRPPLASLGQTPSLPPTPADSPSVSIAASPTETPGPSGPYAPCRRCRRSLVCRPSMDIDQGCKLDAGARSTTSRRRSTATPVACSGGTRSSGSIRSARRSARGCSSKRRRHTSSPLRTHTWLRAGPSGSLPLVRSDEGRTSRSTGLPVALALSSPAGSGRTGGSAFGCPLARAGMSSNSPGQSPETDGHSPAACTTG